MNGTIIKFKCATMQNVLCCVSVKCSGRAFCVWSWLVLMGKEALSSQVCYLLLLLLLVFACTCNDYPFLRIKKKIHFKIILRLMLNFSELSFLVFENFKSTPIFIKRITNSPFIFPHLFTKFDDFLTFYIEIDTGLLETTPLMVMTPKKYSIRII